MRRKGELSAAMIDIEWPHQVAIEADRCSGRNWPIVHEFCKPLSLAPRGHTFLERDRWMNVYCFRERAHADAFVARFGGRIIAPKDRPRWGGRGRKR